MKGNEVSIARSLDKHYVPRIGEKILTDNGKAEILRLYSYDEYFVEKMKNEIASKGYFDYFERRVESIPEGIQEVFDCLIRYDKDGEFSYIEWPDYLAAKETEMRSG